MNDENTKATKTPDSAASALSAGLGAWIRCTERMPERWESVLLSLAGMVPMTTFVWTGERWQVGVSDTEYPYTPEFWMPMPKAPNDQAKGPGCFSPGPA